MSTLSSPGKISADARDHGALNSTSRTPG